jgi:hypothetical protein
MLNGVKKLAARLERIEARVAELNPPPKTELFKLVNAETGEVLQSAPAVIGQTVMLTFTTHANTPC